MTASGSICTHEPRRLSEDQFDPMKITCFRPSWNRKQKLRFDREVKQISSHVALPPSIPWPSRLIISCIHSSLLSMKYFDWKSHRAPRFFTAGTLSPRSFNADRTECSSLEAPVASLFYHSWQPQKSRTCIHLHKLYLLYLLDCSDSEAQSFYCPTSQTTLSWFYQIEVPLNLHLRP